MIKILTVIGARPQIIKAAAISRAIRNHYSDQIEETIVHSGQHYDKNMSQVFFEEMAIPKEKYNLGVGSASHAQQTAQIMTGIEEVIEKESPNVVLLYGDTNSTLAAALVASKLNIPIVHVEGGVRNQTKDYPEEINRILTDNLSSIIFVPNKDGIACLEREGFSTENIDKATKDNTHIFLCGDVMYDNAVYFSNEVDNRFLEKHRLAPNEYVLLTMHRHNLSENDKYVIDVFAAMEVIAALDSKKVVYPVHPRIKKQVERLGLKHSENILLIEPVSYMEMIALEKNASLIITDSGGVQKEAYFHEKPCLILLEYTPWIELVQTGTAVLCGYKKERIVEGYKKLSQEKDNLKYPALYGDGKASEFICELITKNFYND